MTELVVGLLGMMKPYLSTSAMSTSCQSSKPPASSLSSRCIVDESLALRLGSSDVLLCASVMDVALDSEVTLLPSALFKASCQRSPILLPRDEWASALAGVCV